MDFTQARELVLIAIASDDVLCDWLVLKGGSALELIHKIGNRGSLDSDFSIEGGVDDPEALEQRLTKAITDRFDAAGFVTFDHKMIFQPRLRVGTVPDWWGGYNYSFKVISRENYKLHAANLQQLRNHSIPMDAAMRRSFEIQISRAEYCRDSEVVNVGDGFPLRVYTPSMIVCEKLRAICQQMASYEMNSSNARAARARDFYDIYMVTETRNVDLMSDTNLIILRAMFAAKHVPLGLLLQLEGDRELHRQDWPKVTNSVSGHLETFDFYFDYVLGLVERLKARGKV